MIFEKSNGCKGGDQQKPACRLAVWVGPSGLALENVGRGGGGEGFFEVD